jgi:hypothetical protein
MVIIDINEDNNEDILIANKHDTHIKIFLNFATGQLADEKMYLTVIGISLIVTGDMNDDGKIDIIGKNRGNSLTIFYNTGNETFNNQLIIPTDRGPTDIDVADINGDDQQDIVLTTYYQANIIILFNMGNDTFTNKTTYEVDYVPSKVKVIDINDDNTSDIVIVTRYSIINVLFNSGDGTFLNQMIYLGNEPAFFLLSFDMNNDNKVDIIFANHDGNFQVLYNKGNGTFYVQLNI